MKLIDLANIRGITIKGIGDPEYDEAFIEGARQVYELIHNAPAVDAIPVKWLEKVGIDADDAGDTEMRDAITSLFTEWERQKEAWT